MKTLRLTRDSARAWKKWRRRNRKHHHADSECWRCAELEARVVVLSALVARLESGDCGGHVIPIWPNGPLTPGGRVQAIVDSLFASVRNHPVVWGLIGAVNLAVFVTIIYKTVQWAVG